MKLKQLTLKHSIQPYTVIFIVISLIFLFGIYAAFLLNDWNSWWWPLLALFIYILKIYFFDLHYSIFYNNETITMQVATWLPTSEALTSVKIADITEIRNETSDLRTLVARRRVSQRIAIYDKPNQKFIDVSLKHFTRDDILKLLQYIKVRRPDLNIPPI